MSKKAWPDCSGVYCLCDTKRISTGPLWVCACNLSNPKWQMPGIKLKSERRSGWGEGGAETLGLERLCAWGWPLSLNQSPFGCFFPKRLQSECLYMLNCTWRAAFCIYYSMPGIVEGTYLWILSPDLELHPWPGCISQLLTWECWLVSWELLKTHTSQPDPVVLPSASESSTPIYANVDPPARAPQTDRKETTGKAPLYTGIGPVDESGIPVAIRTVSKCCSRMLILCFHIYNVQLRINIILWYNCMHFCHAHKSQKQIVKAIYGCFLYLCAFTGMEDFLYFCQLFLPQCLFLPQIMYCFTVK